MTHVHELQEKYHLHSLFDKEENLCGIWLTCGRFDTKIIAAAWLEEKTPPKLVEDYSVRGYSSLDFDQILRCFKAIVAEFELKSIEPTVLEELWFGE